MRNGASAKKKKRGGGGLCSTYGANRDRGSRGRDAAAGHTPERATPPQKHAAHTQGNPYTRTADKSSAAGLTVLPWIVTAAAQQHISPPSLRGSTGCASERLENRHTGSPGRRHTTAPPLKPREHACMQRAAGPWPVDQAVEAHHACACPRQAQTSQGNGALLVATHICCPICTADVGPCAASLDRVDAMLNIDRVVGLPNAPRRLQRQA